MANPSTKFYPQKKATGGKLQAPGFKHQAKHIWKYGGWLFFAAACSL
jgi:hypothetical protein